MDRVLESRLTALEVAHDLGRKTRILWGSTSPEADIAALVASGAGSADDRWISIGWREGGAEQPMAGDVDRFSAAPKPAAPAAVPWAPGGGPLQVPAIVPLPDNDWGGASWFWGRDWTCDT